MRSKRINLDCVTFWGRLVEKIGCATFWGRSVGQFGVCNILGMVCWTNYGVQHFGDGLLDKLGCATFWGRTVGKIALLKNRDQTLLNRKWLKMVLKLGLRAQFY